MLEGLEAQARHFAADISDLLNKTVTHGIQVSSATTEQGDGIIGAGISKKRSISLPIPISPSREKAVVFLYLLHAYKLDSEGIHLTITKSTMSLYTSPKMKDEQLIVGIDYTRNPSNHFPAAHLHVAGQRDDLDGIYLGYDRKTRKLRDLHLPVGGKRFRPTLEDLVEFMITEEMVNPRGGWEQVLQEHRSRWEAIQLKAAVRRNPEDAATELRDASWEVTAPKQ